MRDDRWWDRFFSKIERRGRCWIFKGASFHRGYGWQKVGARRVRATHIMWRIVYGWWPTFLCHHCDTPACVRPTHLYAGSPQTNGRDMRIRKRARNQWTGTTRSRAMANEDALHQFNALCGERMKRGREKIGRKLGDPFVGDPYKELIEEMADAANYLTELERQRRIGPKDADRIRMDIDSMVTTLADNVDV